MLIKIFILLKLTIIISLGSHGYADVSAAVLSLILQSGTYCGPVWKGTNVDGDPTNGELVDVDPRLLSVSLAELFETVEDRIPFQQKFQLLGGKYTVADLFFTHSWGERPVRIFGNDLKDQYLPDNDQTLDIAANVGEPVIMPDQGRLLSVTGPPESLASSVTILLDIVGSHKMLIKLDNVEVDPDLRKKFVEASGQGVSLVKGQKIGVVTEFYQGVGSENFTGYISLRGALLSFRELVFNTEVPMTGAMFYHLFAVDEKAMESFIQFIRKQQLQDTEWIVSSELSLR